MGMEGEILDQVRTTRARTHTHIHIKTHEYTNTIKRWEKLKKVRSIKDFATVLFDDGGHCALP